MLGKTSTAAILVFLVLLLQSPPSTSALPRPASSAPRLRTGLALAAPLTDLSGRDLESESEAISSSPIHVPLYKKNGPGSSNHAKRSLATLSSTDGTTTTYGSKEFTAWLENQAKRVSDKYGLGHPTPLRERDEEWFRRRGEEMKVVETGLEKRQNAEVLYNAFTDSEYFGQIQVGTPGSSLYVILDTGSSDLWIASSSCTTGCANIPTFNPSVSSTLKTSTTAFQVTYGSGSAAGTLVTDKITMAGYEVSNQVFALATQVATGLLEGAVSGLMGLAFKSIAASGATPFWQNLESGNVLPSNEFGFALTRFVNDTSATTLEPGGIMVLGGTNSSLYTGSINYVPLVSQTYWLVNLGGVSVNGAPVSINATDAAIDTGTSLIAGPPSAVAAIFAAIPGASLSTDPSFNGYYEFPCSTQVTLSLTFNGVSYDISPADFNLGQVTRSSCIGAVFGVTQSSNSPSWIVGDTFLKNVYSSYRANPAAVGFASLSFSAEAQLRNQPVSLSFGTGVQTGALLPTGSSSSSTPGSGTTSSGGDRLVAWYGAVVGAVVGLALLA